MGIQEPLLDLEDPDVFGERDDFWLIYEKQARDHAEDMLKRLNSNLDVLLIFAGLFSAVNTAFIVLTLSSLSADPAEETNTILRLLAMSSGTGDFALALGGANSIFVPTNASIRQNCTFFASLCSSLLAASGAVLAKQWLQNYERTGKTRSIKKQALERTEKFIGAGNWGLEPIIEILPTLLIISLALFFAGLSDYLWTVNKTVSVVVIAFASAGAVFYTFTVVAAAIYKDCPFQTSPGFGLRRITIQMLSAASYASTRAKHALMTTLIFKRFLLWIYWPLTDLFTSFEPMAIHLLEARAPKGDPVLMKEEERTNRELLYTRAILWMVEHVPETDNMLVVARNISLLSSLEAIQLIPRTAILSSLLHHLRLSLLAVQLQSTSDTLATATAAATAVAHIALAESEQCKNAVWETVLGPNDLDRWEWRRWLPSDDLLVIFASIVGLCQRYGRDSQPFLRSFPDSRAVRETFERGAVSQSAATIYLHHWVIIAAGGMPHEDQYGVSRKDIVCIGVKLLGLESVPRSPAFLSFASHALSLVLKGDLGEAHLHGPTWDANIRYAWYTRSGRNLLDDVLTALQMFNNYLVARCHRRSLSIDPSIIRYLTLLLSRLRILSPSWDFLLLEERSSTWDSGTAAQKMHFIHNALLRSLSRLLNVGEVQRGIDTSNALRVCHMELFHSVRSLLSTSSPALVDLKVLDDTAHLVLGLEGDQSAILEALLIVYDYALQDFILWGWKYTQRRLGHSFLASHALLAPVLAKALQLYPSRAAASAWRMLQQLLGNMADDSLEPGRVLQHGGLMEPDAETSSFLYRAHIVGPLIQILRCKSKEQGFHLDSVRRCLLWLIQRIRDQPHSLTQLEVTGVAELFISIMKKTDKEVNGISKESSLTMGALFLESWASTSSLATGEPLPKAASTLQTPLWTSSATINAFRILVQTLDRIVSSRTSLDGSAYAGAPIDGELVLRFIEYAASYNPEATILFGLDSTCERWMYRYLEWGESQAILMRWEVTKFALFEARKLKIASDVPDVKWWQYGGLGETCRAHLVGNS
ncbi:hypothetical protein FRB94_001203 [Tulasnella sp. JGI-2019a]|nr:hypothetical protein FRB94_001203 [Tulasnella sp. JGI-2019a]